MKTVVLEGKTYTKASEVAKQFRYTSDYIGQLCRGKKVDARLIGRTWFVYVPSVEAHRDQRYAYQKSQATPVPTLPSVQSEHSVDMTSKKFAKRVVPPPLTHRPFEPKSPPAETFFNPRPKYESDEYALYPKIAKEPKITLLKVGIAESEQLSISSAKKTLTTLKPEPLPEVILSGSLSVKGIADNEEAIVEEMDTEEKTSESIRDNQENKEIITLHPTSKQTNRPLSVKIETESSVRAVAVSPVKRVPATAFSSKRSNQPTSRYTYQVAVKRVTNDAMLPITASDEDIVTEVPIISPWRPVQTVGLYVVGVLCALVTAGMFLTAGSEVVATTTMTSRLVVFQPAAVMEVFAYFLR